MSVVKSVLHIHGSGYAPLLVAVSLQRAYPGLARSISVSLAPVEQSTRVLTSFSDMVAFNRFLKISEQNFIKSCRASFHLAIRYSGVDGARYFSESDFGAMWERTQFHQLYHVYRLENSCAFDEFCLAALLAKKNNFARPSEQKGFPFAALKYGYQFDDTTYSEALLAEIATLGIQVYQAQVNAVNIHHGHLQALIMREDIEQRAELFIDCSATRDIVRHTHPEAAMIPAIPSWQRQDRYDSIAAQELSSGQQLPSASELQFDQVHSRISKVTLLRTGCYESIYRFSQSNDLPSEANYLPQSWCNNTLSLGEASVQLPNLLVDQRYLLQRQLLKLIAMGALTDAGAGIKQLFNRTNVQDLEQLIDIDNIHVAHLLADKCLLTDRNKQRVALFESAGSLYEIDNAILSAKQWLALLIAMGYKQQAADVEVLRLSSAQINKKLTALRANIKHASEHSESHAQWLVRAGV